MSKSFRVLNGIRVKKNQSTDIDEWNCLLCFHENGNLKRFDDDQQLLRHVCAKHTESSFYKQFKKMIKITNASIEMGIVKP